MENGRTDTNPSGTSPKSDLSIPVYPIAPFVSPSQNSANLPPATSQPPPASITSSTSDAATSQDTPGAIGTPTQTNRATSASPNSDEINSISPSQTSSATASGATTSQTEELSGTSVTVHAVPANNSKHPGITENVAPPPPGALIAFGVLTSFFIILTICLLLWRRRRNSNSVPKDTLAGMEEAHVTTGKSEGSPEKASSFSNTNAMSYSKTHEQCIREGISKPSRGRSTFRLAKPPLLHIDPRMNHQELQATNEPELEPLKLERPGSWRSSIACVWETLGLPNRVLQDTNAQPWDDPSLHSLRPSQNVLHATLSIPEKSGGETPYQYSDTPTSVSNTRASDSPTLSSSSLGNSKIYHSASKPQESPLIHSNSFLSQESKQLPKDSQLNEATSSTPNSIFEVETQDSHITTSDDVVKSLGASPSRTNQNSQLLILPAPKYQAIAA